MHQSFYGKIRSLGYDIGTEQDQIFNFYLTKLGKLNPVLEPMCGTILNLIPFLEAVSYADGSVVFETNVWCDIEEERIGRYWNKYEKYVNSQLVETDIFDYRVRMYTRAEFKDLLDAAGFKKIVVTTAYQNSSEVTENDGMVFACQ